MSGVGSKGSDAKVLVTELAYVCTTARGICCLKGIGAGIREIVAELAIVGIIAVAGCSGGIPVVVEVTVGEDDCPIC